MDEGKDALVFFGSRSHTFSLRCKPKVHATLQTQKCSPENFSVDNYNSGTYYHFYRFLLNFCLSACLSVRFYLHKIQMRKQIEEHCVVKFLNKLVVHLFTHPDMDQSINKFLYLTTYMMGCTMQKQKIYANFKPEEFKNCNRSQRPPEAS